MGTHCATVTVQFLLVGLCAALVDIVLSLELVDTEARLPVPLANHAAVFDGQDSIYVVGGYDGSYEDTVLKYSLASGVVDVVGAFVPIAFGSAIYHGEKIIYFGGHGREARSAAIYSYSTVTNTFSQIGLLPWAVQAMGLAWDPHEEMAYLFGGYGLEPPHEMDPVFRFNASSGEVEQLGTLPLALSGGAGVWDPRRGIAYVFGGLPDSSQVLQFHPPTNSFAQLPSNLPTTVAHACAVFTEQDGSAYVIGGHGEQSNDLIRFDPNNNRSETLQFDSWPRMLSYSACVYVPNQGKIYIIGGYGSLAGEPSAYRSEILCLDLSPSAEADDTSRTLFFLLVLGLPLLVVSAFAGFAFFRYKRLLRVCLKGRGAKSNSPGREAGLTADEIREFQEGVTVPQHHEFSGPSYVQAETITSQPYDRRYELREDKIAIDRRRILGSGQFGIVYFGCEKQTGTPVAVKTVQPHNSNKVYVKALLSELKVLVHLGTHPHVVNLVGATTTGLGRGEVFLYLEFCAMGDLESFLRKRRNSFVHYNGASEGITLSPTTSGSSSGQYVHAYELSPVTIDDLFRWSVQTASAMEHIASKNVIHGDLASRNILLLDKSCAKITDFGLARKLYHYANYKKTQDTPLPWRSLAPESLREMTFSSQSDAWSFGVLLWEMFNLGEVPYSAGTHFSLDFIKGLQEGLRLPKPTHAPETLYEEMLKCWRLQPEERPSFGQLKTTMETLQIYGTKAATTESYTYL